VKLQYEAVRSSAETLRLENDRLKDDLAAAIILQGTFEADKANLSTTVDRLTEEKLGVQNSFIELQGTCNRLELALNAADDKERVMTAQLESL
jgi:hypothetical protein